MNIFDIPELPLENELTSILIESKNVRIERIVSTGQVSDWYDQVEAEFVVLLQGRAKIEFDDGTVSILSVGDMLNIPPHKKHKVIYTSTEPPCIWLCVFTK